jgi:hypothetical protein
VQIINGLLHTDKNENISAKTRVFASKIIFNISYDMQTNVLMSHESKSAVNFIDKGM